MKVSVNQLSVLFSKYGNGITIKYFEDLVLRGTCYLSTDIVLADHLAVLEENKRETVDVFFDFSLYRLLCSEFPEAYRMPSGKLSVTDVDRYLEELKNAGTASKRKRYIYCINEIYSLDHDRGRQVVLLGCNEALDYKKWNQLKRSIDKNLNIYFRNSETKIIICVDMTMNSDAPYIERFKTNADLISSLVSMTPDHPDFFGPDFIPTQDVISVTDPGALLEEYIRSEARMIIIGEKLNESYKRAVMDVVKYDKYVRMLVVPLLDMKNRDHFIRQVKLVYNSNRW